MNITIFNNKNKIVSKTDIIPAIKGIELDYKKTLIQLGIILLDDSKLQEMNIKYLKSDDYTDIITFNYSEDPEKLDGELYISIDRIKENAKKYNISDKQEMYRVIIHGVLHLVGENDETKEQKNLMQSKENQYLKLICFT